MSRRSVWGRLAVLAALAIFVASTRLSLTTERARVFEEMHVVLPPVAQLVMAGGDRYFAAHTAAVRALVASPNEMTRDQFRVLGLVQRDAARFNPRHEDNYYIAAAILPWYGEVASAREVLARAAEARSFDPYPSFQYAFLLFHFDKDPLAGAEWLKKAAERAPVEEERLMFLQMAASWVVKSADLDASIAMVRSLAKQSRYPNFRNYLNKRADRLVALQQLRLAAKSYRETSGKPLETLEQLLAAKVIAAIPADPFRRGFVLDPNGEVVFAETLRRKTK